MLFGLGAAWHLHRPYCVVAAESGAAPAAPSLPQVDGAGAQAQPPAAGVLESLSSTLASARAMVSNFLDLTVFEARRAGLALMWMVIWGVVAAICIVAAWLALMAALMMWAVSLGLPAISAVIVVGLVNAIAGTVLIYTGMGLSRDLLFSATRRQVAGKPPVKPVAS